MGTTEKVRVILTALGYTPTTFARTTGISIYKSQKILTDSNYVIKVSDTIAFCRATGMSPNTLYRDWEGGVRV